jgi:hypothetical protein
VGLREHAELGIAGLESSPRKAFHCWRVWTSPPKPPNTPLRPIGAEIAQRDEQELAIYHFHVAYSNG